MKRPGLSALVLAMGVAVAPRFAGASEPTPEVEDHVPHKGDSLAAVESELGELPSEDNDDLKDLDDNRGSLESLLAEIDADTVSTIMARLGVSFQDVEEALRNVDASGDASGEEFIRTLMEMMTGNPAVRDLLYSVKDPQDLMSLLQQVQIGDLLAAANPAQEDGVPLQDEGFSRNPSEDGTRA